MKEKNIKIMLIPIIIIALLTSLDQFTKFIIKSKFMLYESKEVIKNVFAITYIQNKGAAWGVMQGKRIFFLILTVFVILGCFWILYNIIDNRKYIMLTTCVIFLISGAVGNMIDRFKLGYVVDFFDFKLIDFPVFNVADIYVTVSMFLILFLMVFKYKEEDFDEIIGKKSNIESDIKAFMDEEDNETMDDGISDDSDKD
ncbi:MAG: signal peptidase II [Lachnospiraceae bacterium]|nr:signal peptidase II [Lachnospiraceae bacterium]